jgi:hypothetical protein
MGSDWNALTAISTDPSARAVPALGRDDIWEGRLCLVGMTHFLSFRASEASRGIYGIGLECADCHPHRFLRSLAPLARSE